MAKGVYMQLGENASRKLGKNRSKELGQHRSKPGGGWGDAIADAERKIGETRARLARLKAALSFCKESQDNGDPFPGQQAAKKIKDTA
jgi:hypothetical protein